MMKVLKGKMNNKKGFILEDDKMVGLAVYKNDFNKYEEAVAVNYKNAIGRQYGDLFYDKICGGKYKIYENAKLAIQALKDGTLKVGEVFCYSLYDYHIAFPELCNLKTKEDVINYLKDYNKKEEVCIYWNFFDDDEIEKLDKKSKELRKKYNYYYY